jgi:D-alanyl-lipoteichoic acid acyltransferase DltB (MBOAT superfamily)
LFLTFLTVGMWHGPGSNFLAFGVLQALGVASAVAWRELRDGSLPVIPRRRGARKLGARVLCFHYVCGSVLFLDNSVGDVFAYFRSLGAWIGAT